ncbi:hypothetical protein F4780DRAFT_454 [Xylariomycetidae sp. FL0641]|nr:hypothetical protein F4780DRAFT_454 [Xylariomycetidae sp. FL0641]
MDRYRGPTMTLPPLIKSEGKRLRRRFQSIGAQRRSCPPTYKEDVSIPNTPKPGQQPHSPSAEDFDEDKWFEQFRKAGYHCRGAPLRQPKLPGDFSSIPSKAQQLGIVPEFAHLTINDVKSKRRPEQVSVPTYKDPIARPRTRRRPKTPVSRIGQLESSSRRHRARVHKTSSVELIAESYRALLESRNSMLQTPTPKPPPLRLDGKHSTGVSNRYTVHDIASGTMAEVGENASSVGSRTSDDDTLVSFEEDTIYFKPISFTPEPSSPAIPEDQPQPTPDDQKSDTSNNPTLQILFDLLAQELSAAARGTPVRPYAETSSLQLLVMIEAYERIRDQVKEMPLDDAQKQSMEAMLDTWLKALDVVQTQAAGREGAENREGLSG